MNLARRTAALIAAAGAGLVLGCFSATAGATTPTTPSGSISNVETPPGHVKLLFVAHDLPSDVGLISKKVSVSIDGSAVPATVTTAAQSSVARSVVLVIDTSGSMAGSGIAGAKSAADTLVQALPADVQVGLVSFADRVTVASPLTMDRTAVKKAIDSLQAGGETALYDGVQAGLRTLGTSGQRRVVVLSDGADTTSKTSLSAVIREATSSRVAVDAVGFRTQDSQQSTLGQLTSATGGVLYAANDAAGVAAAFSSVARSFVTQVYVDATVPAKFAAGPATLTVTAQTDAGTITATTTVELSPVTVSSATPTSTPTPSAVAAAPPTSGHHRANRMLLGAGVVALFLAFSLLSLIAIEKRVERRAHPLTQLVAGYAPVGSAPLKPRPAEDNQGRSARVALAATERLLKAHAWGERLAQRLERAGLTVRANEWLVLQMAASMALIVICVLLGANIVIAAVLCVLATEVALRFWIDHRIERRRAAFLTQLPDALQVLAGSLSTGFSLDQAMDSLLDDSQEPISGEFGRAVSEARLGVPLDVALAHTAERVQLEEFDWAVMAIQVQRTVGGSLAEVLHNVAATIRQREKLRRQVRVLSAEGRISAYILVGLPLVMAAFFLLFKPTYLRPLYHSPGGIAAVVVGAVLLVVGWIWMRKIARVEA